MPKRAARAVTKATVTKTTALTADAKAAQCANRDEFKAYLTTAATPDIESVVTSTFPPNWEKVYANIVKMRSHSSAPVDTMGCDKVPARFAAGDYKRRRLYILVSLMLSSQTKDQVNFDAMSRLIDAQLLNVDNLAEVDVNELGRVIYPVSFWKTKAKNLKSVAAMLRDKFDYDIPDSVQKLCQLPGIGPKMGHICMSSAWNVTEGIGVDTHVHRICNRLGWVADTPNSEATRKSLESWLPRTHWREINSLLVGFGQNMCSASAPKCGTCLNNLLCPFGVQATASKKIKK